MANEQRFRDRVVIVTGGSSGIGEGCVRVFVKHGGKVAFCSNQETEGQSLQEELNKSGPGEVYFIKYSAESEDDIKGVINATIAKYKHIDCLINNVGMHPPHIPIDDTTSDDFQKVLNINVFSCFLTSKYAMPYLRLTKGSIINVASLVGTIGQKEAVTYCASKGAILSMTKAMAIDEARHGVRVNSISPGNIWTPCWKAMADMTPNPTMCVDSAQTHQMLGRFGTPEECGLTCLFLATDATFITGVDLPVSGGAEINYGIKTERLSSSQL